MFKSISVAPSEDISTSSGGQLVLHLELLVASEKSPEILYLIGISVVQVIQVKRLCHLPCKHYEPLKERKFFEKYSIEFCFMIFPSELFTHF